VKCCCIFDVVWNTLQKIIEDNNNRNNNSGIDLRVKFLIHDVVLLLMSKTEKRKGKFFNDFFWLMECAEFYELSCWCASLARQQLRPPRYSCDSWRQARVRARTDSCGSRCRGALAMEPMELAERGCRRVYMFIVLERDS